MPLAYKSSNSGQVRLLPFPNDAVYSITDTAVGYKPYIFELIVDKNARIVSFFFAGEKISEVNWNGFTQVVDREEIKKRESRQAGKKDSKETGFQMCLRFGELDLPEGGREELEFPIRAQGNKPSGVQDNPKVNGKNKRRRSTRK